MAYGETNFYRDHDWSILEIESFDELGRGTTSIGFTLRGDTHDETKFQGIEIEHEVTASAGGIIEDTYTVDDRIDILFDEDTRPMDRSRTITSR